MGVAKNLKLPATTLNLDSRWNCKHTSLQALKLLLLFPFFMVRNAFQYTESILAKVVPCKKDVFYLFLENGAIDRRNLVYCINKQLLRKINLRDDSFNSKDPVCLIIDDSDLPKTGTRFEKMSRIYSHVTHSNRLGFKGLFLCHTEGKTQKVVDISLHGEEGSRTEKPFGMTKMQRYKQYTMVREQTDAVHDRIGEYTQSKIQKAIEMVKHAISEGMRFDYLLAESWFTCTDIIKFIKSRHSCCHFLGMNKIGRTKYLFEKKILSAKELIKLLANMKALKYSCSLHCYYTVVDVEVAGVQVRLFICSRTKNADWSGLLTTNYELSTVKRFAAHQTIGGLFNKNNRRGYPTLRYRAHLGSLSGTRQFHSRSF